MADPIMAGDVKTNNLGVGASAPGEVNPEDDIYEQYKKRMMLGYKHRPNPLVLLPIFSSILFCNNTSLLTLCLSILLYREIQGRRITKGSINVLPPSMSYLTIPSIS